MRQKKSTKQYEEVIRQEMLNKESIIEIKKKGFKPDKEDNKNNFGRC